jgi:NADH dehydrogenase
MTARIFLPARSAMTSGQGNARRWILEYAPEQPRGIDPLMGWTSSADMRSQIRLRFDTREEAVDYAERNAIPYVVEEPRRRAPNLRPRGYGGNFAHDRRTLWTH